MRPHRILLVSLTLLGTLRLFSQDGSGIAPNQSLDPATPNLQIRKLIEEKRWKEVIDIAEGLHKQNAEDTGPFYWSGIAYLQLHDPVKAAQSLRSAEKLGLNTAVFHEGLGLVYYSLNQFFLFEEQMKKASEMDPSDFRPYYYLGLYRWTIRSDAGGALNLFEKAAVLAPDDWKNIYQEGNCLEQLGRLQDARNRYEKAITLIEQAKQAYGWPFQGMARLLKDEDPGNALNFALKAVSEEPNEYSNHLVLAEVYDRLEKIPDAIREAQLATTRNPTNAESTYLLYKLYRKAGDTRAAEELKIFEQVKGLYDAD